MEYQLCHLSRSQVILLLFSTVKHGLKPSFFRKKFFGFVVSRFYFSRSRSDAREHSACIHIIQQTFPVREQNMWLSQIAVKIGIFLLLNYVVSNKNLKKKTFKNLKYFKTFDVLKVIFKTWESKTKPKKVLQPSSTDLPSSSCWWYFDKTPMGTDAQLAGPRGKRQ